MSREIKFRFWDIECPSMESWEEMQEQWEDMGYFDSAFREDHWIAMQFTGLRDKNGAEIYEKSVINKYFYVDYIPSRYIIRRLVDDSIKCNLDEYYNENTTEITEEYTGL